jgi:ATP-dependent RNA circularization protein (DNA/RNA ligase family)
MSAHGAQGQKAMTDFFRFPHTPHLAWLGAGQPRDDKVLAPAEARAFLAGDVVVEEKIDGANLGFSVGPNRALYAQNRGQYLDLDALMGQWKPLRHWLATRRHALVEALEPNLMLFGEWCYAKHSVRYTRLPDWFLSFDIYDRSQDGFWGVDARNRLASRLGLAIAPELGRGRFDLKALTRLLGCSRLTDGPAEGIYVRREAQGRLLERAKLVRPEFVQAIGAHWSARRIEANQLAEAAP